MNNRASPGEEWGFGGLVMTDWGAVHNRNDQLVTEAVRTGLLDEADLDRAVMRVLQLVFRYHPSSPSISRPTTNWPVRPHREAPCC